MSEDIKIKKLEAKCGLAGYAIYNKILEQQYKYSGKFNFKSEDTIRLYCREWGVRKPQLMRIVECCISVELFDDENLSSSSIKERLEKINTHRKNVRERFFSKKSESDKNKDLGIVSTGQNSEETSQSKVKESKEKKSRGEEAPPPGFLKIPFPDFENVFRLEKDYGRYAKYDLQIYFEQVMEKFPGQKSIAVIIKQVKKFIACDETSNGKFSPHLKEVKKKDTVAAAYELVQANLDWINSLPDKNPDEVIPVIASRCREPARHDALFEAYIEKALKHYGCLP